MKKMNNFQESEINTYDKEYINKFQIRGICDNQTLLDIDGFSVYCDIVVKDKNVGDYITIKHFGKNEITKELKNPSII